MEFDDEFGPVTTSPTASSREPPSTHDKTTRHTHISSHSSSSVSGVGSRSSLSCSSSSSVRAPVRVSLADQLRAEEDEHDDNEYRQTQPARKKARTHTNTRANRTTPSDTSIQTESDISQSIAAASCSDRDDVRMDTDVPPSHAMPDASTQHKLSELVIDITNKTPPVSYTHL